MATIQEIKAGAGIAELNKILPVVVRVHGEGHPELARVGELYHSIMAEGRTKEELLALTGELKTVTSGFTVPEDACPTYARSYGLLAELTKEIEGL